MKYINTIEEVQSISFEILKYLKKVCEQHNIHYYLGCGTLLGAVRHKDFIPWDDDVDVFMPYEDYIQFSTLMKDNPDPVYKLVSKEICSEYTAPSPKLIDSRTVLKQEYGFKETMDLGIYIDIFVLGGCPGETIEEAKKYCIESQKIIKGWIYSSLIMFPKSKSPLMGLLCWVKNTPYRIFGTRRYLRKMEKHNWKYMYYQSKYVAPLEGYEKEMSVWNSNCFGGGSMLEFRGELFCAPKKYHEVLEMEFGDYMTLPPEKDRHSNHIYTAYWL